MIELCLRRYADGGDTEARHVACFTLEQMCKGGIFDQLGGGFARYSTDNDWAIPHFEKMLYDNGRCCVCSPTRGWSPRTRNRRRCSRVVRRRLPDG
jgi:uncharacterized protein YyaL (SSP411 family)